MKYFYMAAFGVVGVLSRYFLSAWWHRVFPSTFPAATLVINMLGSFVIGVIFVLAMERSAMSEDLRLGIMVGLLGGFTTFSAYSLETARLLEREEYLHAFLYFGLSPVICVLCTFAGILISRR